MSLEPAFTERLVSVIRNELGITPRHAQLKAARYLEQRMIVEMETGEGKTLSSAMAAIKLAQQGNRIFVATANDYLAQRDAVEMQPLYDRFGLRAAAVTSPLDRESRRQVYAGDVVYGAIRELGFDTLRDAIDRRNINRNDSPLVPKFHSMIVDEADSVLIDEALTPLVISGCGELLSSAKEALYRWSAERAKAVHYGVDYVINRGAGGIALTDNGIANVIRTTMPSAMNGLRMTEILHSLERAIEVATQVVRDKHYIVKDNRVLLVDEFTGRLANTKKMGGGLHQAVEAKESLPITSLGVTVARMTIQELVNRVPHLCGITATAREDQRELRRVYDLKVQRLPPNVRSQRIRLPMLVFADNEQKMQGIVAESQAMIAAGRAVLIGTRTIDQSEQLSTRMKAQHLEHVLLNARQSSEEASIVAQAGQAGRVTVATNMAGRGTDIRLSDPVRSNGGLHVIVSEPHAAARIDRQLAGRCGRQGDPGSVRHYLAADDEIFGAAFGEQAAVQIASRVSDRCGQAKLTWKSKRAQRMIASQHREQRYQLAEADSRVSDDLQELGLDPHLDRLYVND